MKNKKRPSRGGKPRATSGSGKHNFKRPGKRKSFGGKKFSNGKNSKFSKSNSRSGSHKGARRGGGRKQPTFDPSKFINTNPVDLAPVAYESENDFTTFGLSKKLSDVVHSIGITIPTPIQDQVIPEIMKGNDVIGIAETGTGKTAAFLLPLIEKNIHDGNRQTLIMAPTRELAMQINEELRLLSKPFRLYSTVCVGGMGINQQIRNLKRKNHYIIGTPGRLLDLIKRRDLDLSSITTVVLDEADRMLDMGFIHDMRNILSKTPQNRETLFFSATMPIEAKRLVNDFMINPVEISVKKRDVTNSISQDVISHGHHDKYETLSKLLSDREFKRVIIFGAMKHSVKRLANQLSSDGFKSESIHGNKTHGQRVRALDAFKSGQARVLVATDVAARGIHVDGVTHVINYDLPTSFEDYVHRIGRTGRGEKRGKALTFVQRKPVKDRL